MLKADPSHRADRARLETESRPGTVPGKASSTSEGKTEEAPRTARTWRNTVYSRIRVSVHTMDIVIAVIVALLIISLILGILTGN